MFLNGPRRAPALSRRDTGSSIPLLRPTRPPEASFSLGSGRWALALVLAARRQSLAQSLRRLDTGHKKQQHKTELVGWCVACFFKSHAAQLRHWVWSADHFPHQATSSISLQSHNEAWFESQNEKTELHAVFRDPFRAASEPLGWFVLFICAAGRQKFPWCRQLRI